MSGPIMLVGGMASTADPAWARPRLCVHLLPVLCAPYGNPRIPTAGTQRAQELSRRYCARALSIMDSSASIRFRTENLLRCTRSLCATSGREHMQQSTGQDAPKQTNDGQRPSIASTPERIDNSSGRPRTAIRSPLALPISGFYDEIQRLADQPRRLTTISYGQCLA